MGSSHQAVGGAYNAVLLSGAVVSFDGDHSVPSVSGDFGMAVGLNMSGSHFQGDSATEHHRADLCWDGAALQIVRISGILG